MPPGVSPIDTIADSTARRIWQIAQGYCRPAQPDAAAAAALATLRRGLGKRPGDVPELWSFTVPIVGDHLGAEPAVFHALTLFALHQQSQRTAPMHASGNSFGRACSRLAAAVRDAGGNDTTITRRFVVAGSASTLDAFAVHARGMVTMLRQHQIPLDYRRLVLDAHSWQRPTTRNATRRRWGHDFYRPARAPEATTSADTEDTSSTDAAPPAAGT